MKPRFTIVAVDYDQWVPREDAKRGLRSLQNQIFTNFEVILLHDGPRTTNVVDELDLGETSLNITYLSTHERFNLWGHPQRHLGVQLAKGDYIIHFNCDNYLEPFALDLLDQLITQADEPDAIVFAIRWDGRYFKGLPVKPGHIDCLQMCASKKVWDSIGGWFRYDGCSDGFIYEHIASKYPIYHLDVVLGDNYISNKDNVV
jgi:hypothetical protein